MTIRPATLKDVDAILQLIAEVVPLMNASGNFQWDSHYPNRQVFEKDIALKQLWAADIDGQLAGIAAITTSQQAEYANVGMDVTQTAIVTHRLAVSIHHRGLRIAETLLLQAEKVAAERGINILRIDTNSNNKATRRLFPKLGYEFMGETGFQFRPNLRFYCYEKMLANAIKP
jgi:ribosomal protein S18 acetylase RimI-like enzyme